MSVNKEILLVSRPTGHVSVDNFAVKEVALTTPELSSGDLYVTLLFASVDPYMRGRLNDGPSYAAPWQLDQPGTGGIVAKVIESKHEKFQAGDFVYGYLPWRQFQVVPSPAVGGLTKIPDALKDQASYFLGACGMPGLSALLPLNHLSNAKAGETAFVSGAAGAVGSVAGQLLKLRGLKVFGSAGTDEKVRWLLEEAGFDGAWNYNAANTDEKLKELAPQGIDVFFDNVGGQTLETLLDHMRKHGRVILCGSISNYNKPRSEQFGVRNLFNVTTKSLRIAGFIVSDWSSEFQAGTEELVGLVKENKLKIVETVVDGFENLPKAFVGLFSGENKGKMIVKV